MVHAFILFQKNNEPSFVIHLPSTTMGKLRDMEGIWVEDRLDRSPCGLRLLWVCAPLHIHNFYLCPFPLLFLDVTFQFSEDKQFIFVIASFVSMVSIWCLWFAWKPGALPCFLVTLVHWLLSVFMSEREGWREGGRKGGGERERERY